MRKIITLALVLFTGTLSSNAFADADDVTDFYKEHKNDEIMVDIFKKKFFAPPYESYDSLFDMAEVCKEDFFDGEPMYREYARIITKSEYLGTAAPEVDSVLDEFVKNSGGISALYEYVSEDFIYLVNVGNIYQAKDAAQRLSDQFDNSPQSKKVQAMFQVVIDKKQNKKVDKNAYKKAKATFLCSTVDVFYTVFGGKEYSNSANTLSQVKKQIQNETMASNLSQLEEAMKE